MQALLFYLLLINALALVLMFADKQKAKKHRWRIPESTLLLSGFLGGSLGGLAGMYLFRHKTRHRKFTILMPLFLALHLALLALLLLRRAGVL